MFNSKFDLELQAIFDTFYISENNLEQTLVKLKEAGASQIDSIKVLIKKLNISLKEADNIVLHSECWSESKQETISLRNNLYDDLSKNDKF